MFFLLRKFVLKLHRLFFLCVAISILQGCVTRLGDLSVASTKNINLKTETHRVDTSRRVKGEDVVHIISFIPTSMYPNLEEAMDNAIEKVPGAVALSDVTIKRGVWYIPLIYGQDYIEIEGNPVFEDKVESKTALKESPQTYTNIPSKTDWKQNQLQQLSNEKGISYEEYQRRYRAIVGQ